MIIHVVIMIVIVSRVQMQDLLLLYVLIIFAECSVFDQVVTEYFTELCEACTR